MLAKEIKEKFPSKTIWLYTGYEWKDIKNMDIVNYLDVLVDGEFEVEKKNWICTGKAARTRWSLTYRRH